MNTPNHPRLRDKVEDMLRAYFPDMVNNKAYTNATTALLTAFTETAERVIGEDQKLTGTNAHIDIEREARNALRKEQHNRLTGEVK